MNSSKRGIHIYIRSFACSSLIDMINLKGDEYPSLAHLDSYNHGNIYHEEDNMIANFNRLYKPPPHVKIEPTLPGDRTCQWDGNVLYVYRGALTAGFRSPLHEFFRHILADSMNQRLSTPF